MHRAVAVGVLQAVAHLDEDIFHLFLGECAHAHMFGQRLAFDVFEDDAVAQAFDLHEVDGAADKLVVEPCSCFIFLTQRSLA